jgi:hypothetical protein
MCIGGGLRFGEMETIGACSVTKNQVGGRTGFLPSKGA